MGALENAKKLSRTDIIDKTEEYGLSDYGIHHFHLADLWKKTITVSEERKRCVVAGLNNCDTSHVLMKLVEENTDKIMEGLNIAAYVTQADQMCLYIPEGKITDSLIALAKKYGVELREGMVEREAYQDEEIYHIETMLALAEIFTGDYLAGAWISIESEGKMGQLKKIPFGTKIIDIPEVITEEMKAFAIGRELYPVEAADELALEKDMQPSDGVIRLFSEGTCMVDEAKKVLKEERIQSCGKCLFCREGLIQLDTMAEDITGGKGKQSDPGMIQEIGEAMKFSCNCSMGQTGADFILGTLTHFQNEYEDHIKKKKCKNNVCTAFQNIYIDPQLCNGCEECADVCSKDAIEGKAGYIHMIDEFECDKCGKCMEMCGSNAIIRTSGRLPKLPERLVKVGKFKKH